MAEKALSKSEFATLCGVDPSRVSHWIKDGKISGPALVGVGRKARIVPSIAQKQLRNRIDIGQRMGNGLGTRLNTAPAPEPSCPAQAPPAPSQPGVSELLEIIAGAPFLAAGALEGHGVPLRARYAVFLWLSRDLSAELVRLGLRAPEFMAEDWAEQAAAEGETVDLDAWRAWTETITWPDRAAT